MRPVNFRYDEFLSLDQSVQITAEQHVVPAVSPFYVAGREIPKQESPSTVVVRGGGTSVSLTPTDDAWTDEGYSTTNHGSGSINAAGRDDAGLGSWIYRAFHKWDISSGPSVASLAKVRFYRVTGQAAPTFGIHRVSASWSQSTLTHASQPSFDPVADGQFTIIANQNGWYEAEITDLYNAWKAATYDNYGIVLRTEEVDTNTVSNWSSSEGTYPPQLVVVGAGAALQEVAYSVTPGPGQVAVHYGTGRYRFHSSLAGLPIEIDYWGLGSPIDAYDWFVDPPASSNAPGRKGQYAFDAVYAYHCFEDNQWTRAAHAGW